jgi:arylsulfatase A-like enzyme
MARWLSGKRWTTWVPILGILGVVNLWSAEQPANVVIISVDTLRADRLSSYGYDRETSPNIDRLLAKGVRFTEARTVEPLTAPALASMLISMPPHEHGSTRNGLRVRQGTPSLPRVLRRQGYRTAAFVGSWTLRRNLWEMNDHFDTYEAILTKSRWLGVWSREARAEDINKNSLQWLESHVQTEGRRPFLLWVHYVEPHAPYVLQESFLEQIGVVPESERKSKSYRYDSEIAYVDDQIGRFLEGVGEVVSLENTLVVFVSDHGESLGEHNYWGHGRNLFEPNLRIPMGIVFPGQVAPRVESAPALISDIAPTVVSLLSFEVPDFFQGFDWAPVFSGEIASPMDRITHYEAHKGAVRPYEAKEGFRERGLMEVGRLAGKKKELFRLKGDKHMEFDLVDDQGEVEDLVSTDSEISAGLKKWLIQVQKGLVLADDLPPPSLSEEDTEALRALGYLD